MIYADKLESLVLIHLLIKESLQCIHFFLFLSFFGFEKKIKTYKASIINREISSLGVGGTISNEFGSLTNLQEL